MDRKAASHALSLLMFAGVVMAIILATRLAMTFAPQEPKFKPIHAPRECPICKAAWQEHSPDGTGYDD